MRAFLALLACLVAVPAAAQLNPSSPQPMKETKDAGRTLVTLTADAVAPAATDTIVTFAKLVGDTATAAQTTYAVTAGKTLRVEAISLSLTSSTTTVNKVRVRLRTLSSGACVATSTQVGTWEIGWSTPTTPVANAPSASVVIPFPDGLEFSGATRNVCFSAIAVAANATLTITLIGYEY